MQSFPRFIDIGQLYTKIVCFYHVLLITTSLGNSKIVIAAKKTTARCSASN